MGTQATIQTSRVGTWPPARGRGDVAVTTLLAGGVTLAAGVWALAAPSAFADYTGFDPYNEHFVHDLGAFQLGIGATLLLALAWRDGPALPLAGFLVGNTVHAIKHVADLDGGRARDASLLLALSLADEVPDTPDGAVAQARQSLRRQPS